MEKIYEIC